MIYLDYCANTPVDETVLDTFIKTERMYYGNANSHHEFGYQASQIIDTSLEQIANLIHVKKEELIITSGATEANNLAIKGIALASKHVGKHILSTSLEHTSVSASLTALQASGYEIDLIPITKEGIIDLEELEYLIRDDTCLITISSVDSEVGIQQPIKQIRELLNQYPECKLHIDATQAIGKIPVDFSLADTISFAPHKFFGLNGIGILVKKEHVSLVPQISGGSSTTIYRSGTPTTGLITSIVPALQDALTNLEKNYTYVETLNAYLRENLKHSSIQINSPSHAIPHILNVSIKGIKGYEMQQALNEKGICVSVKSACSSDYLPSHAVMALVRDRKRALESFRISLSKLTTKQEIDTLIQAINEIINEKGINHG